MDHTGSQSAQGNHFVVLEQPDLILTFLFQLSHLSQVPEKGDSANLLIPIEHDRCRKLNRDPVSFFVNEMRLVKKEPIVASIFFGT